MNKEKFLIGLCNPKYIGDDGVVIGDYIYSMDSFCEDIHFRRSWMSIEQIAHKAMVVNISDAIAMNATPRYALVTLKLPNEITYDEIGALYKALEQSANEYGCEIVGGDTVAGERLDITITIISTSKEPLYRSGIKEGYLLAYTGELGESLWGLQQLERGKKLPCNHRFFRPKLRGEFIAKARGLIAAGMDISDGLYCDTNTLLQYNQLSCRLLCPIEDAVGKSGEEYEMLIAYKKSNEEEIFAIANRCNVPLTPFAVASKEGKMLPCDNHHF